MFITVRFRGRFNAYNAYQMEKKKRRLLGTDGVMTIPRREKERADYPFFDTVTVHVPSAMLPIETVYPVFTV